MSRSADANKSNNRPATWGRGRAVRLREDVYAGDWPFHVIMCAWRGRPFADRAVATMVCSALEESIARTGYELYAYCLMPDHLHVLLSPATSGTTLAVFLRRFKSYTTNRYWALGGSRRLWQRSAKDRLMRTGEKPGTLIRYIVGNPVRAGLVRSWRDWPYTKLFLDP